MADEGFTNSINLDVTFSDDNMMLSVDEISEILKNDEFKREMNKTFEEFRSYLASLSGINHIGYYNKTLSIIIDEDYKPQLVFSVRGFSQSVIMELGPVISLYPVKVNEALSKLFETKNPDELNKNFPNLYMHSYMPNLFYGNKNKEKVTLIITRYEEREKNPEEKNKITPEERTEYLRAKSSQNFFFFRKCAYDYYKTVVNRHSEIEEWIKSHKINIKLSEEENQKLFLYLIRMEMESIFLNAFSQYKDKAQKSLIIYEGLIKKYKELYPNSNLRIEYHHSNELMDMINNAKVYNTLFLSDNKVDELLSDTNEKMNIGIRDIELEFSEEIKKYPYLRQNVILPQIDRTLTFDENKKNAEKYISDLLTETIHDDQTLGAHDATEEVKNRVKQLEKEIASESISINDKREKTIILKKIKMVLNDIKPKAVQTGTGKVFRNYYVYYYPNGMVALDRIDGYGALYIMPAHIYREARYKDNLTDVKNIPGVQRVNHKNNQWLDIAKDYIEKGTDGLTEDDIKKSSEVASIDFPYTVDKLEELEKMFAEEENEIGVNETKRRIRKTKELKEIDTELKENEFDNYNDIPVEMRQKVEQLDGEKEDVLNSNDIEEMAFSEKTFEELYEEWKKNHEKKKKARNPVVAAITKRRSMNENGRYCCEWCRKDYLNTSPLRSHHVRPLSQGGPDNIYNTVCICPDCHDYVHSHEITDEEQYRLFEIVRKHIEEENPEYLPAFNEMMSPIAKDEEDYINNKAIIDRNFELQWNDVNIRKR